MSGAEGRPGTAAKLGSGRRQGQGQRQSAAKRQQAGPGQGCRQARDSRQVREGRQAQPVRSGSSKVTLQHPPCRVTRHIALPCVTASRPHVRNGPCHTCSAEDVICQDVQLLLLIATGVGVTGCTQPPRNRRSLNLLQRTPVCADNNTGLRCLLMQNESTCSRTQAVHSWLC